MWGTIFIAVTFWGRLTPTLSKGRIKIAVQNLHSNQTRHRLTRPTMARPLFLHCWNGPLLSRELATQQASSAATLSNNRCKVTKKHMFKAFQSQALEWDPAAWQIDTDCTCGSAVTPSLKSNSRTADLARPLFLHCWNGPLLARELATQQASSAATLSNNRCKVTKKHMFKAFQSQALEWDPAAWQIDTDCTCGSAVTPSLKSNSRTADLARPLFLHCWNGPLLPRELATQQASSAATLSNNRCKVTKKHMFKAFQSQALEWDPAAWQIDTDCTCGSAVTPSLKSNSRTADLARPLFLHCWNGPLLPRELATQQASSAATLSNNRCKVTKKHMFKAFQSQALEWDPAAWQIDTGCALRVWERRNTKSQIQLENGWLGPPAFLALLKWTASTKRTSDPTSVQCSNSQQQPLQSHQETHVQSISKPSFGMGPCRMTNWYRLRLARVGAP